MHEVARGAEAVLVLETLAGDRVLGFHIPSAGAARLARVLGLARCRRAPIYDLVHHVAARLGGRVTGAVLDAEAQGICARLRVAPPAKPPSRSRSRAIPPTRLASRCKRALRSMPRERPSSTPPGPGRAGCRRRSLAWIERVSPADFVIAPQHEKTTEG
jgi:hypothetical protein